MNTNELAIVIVVTNDDDQMVFGPFANGQEATNWGFANHPNKEWYWLPLNSQSKRGLAA